MSRPAVLFPLFAGLETLAGVGPKSARLFAQIGVERPRDLLFTLPHAVIDRRLRPSIRGLALPDEVAEKTSQKYAEAYFTLTGEELGS